MMDVQESFRNTLRSLAAIPQLQIDAMWAIARTRTMTKGESFIHAGDVPSKFAIVTGGLFRYYYSADNGTEYTKGFFPEGTFISSYSAMIQHRGSYFTIEALEASTVVEVPYGRWKTMAADDPAWNRLLIALLERGYCTKESRERELLLFDAEQRYASFIETHPGLEARLKQHYIASFLGMSPVTLSRIRARRRS